MTLPMGNAELVQIVDAALADATRRAQKPDGTSWLSCRPGCTSCCHGVFQISMLDAERLRSGLRELEQHDAASALAIQERAHDLVAAFAASFPGDPATGLLSATDDAAWDRFADLPETDTPCPVLDPRSGQCLLYASRPLTCRVFGPPIQNEAGIGMCELCYIGATDAEILHGEMSCGHTLVEAQLDRDMPSGTTVITWALLP